jgi:enamine deaminase RidA (YjgF/YER057c/UK114 family)
MFERNLSESGIVLPEPVVPKFSYVPVVLHGGVAYVSGQLPWVRDGELVAVGRAGETVDLESARQAARQCALQGLACLRQALGSLDRVERVLKVVGFVASGPGFRNQPQVVDAASRLFLDVFGEAGRHARSAVGVAELPRGAPVEVELVVAYRD